MSRYVVIGLLSVWYGRQAVDFLETHGKTVALWVAILSAVGIAAWLLVRHYRREPALTSAG